MTAAMLDQVPLPDSKWEFGLATVGALTVVLAIVFCAVLLVKVIGELAVDFADRRRDRKLEAAWHLEEARLAADKVIADRAADDSAWASLTDAAAAVAVPAELLAPAPFRPRVIYGIDHTAARHSRDAE